MKRWIWPIVVVALALRLAGLGTWSFWNDEIATVQEARDLFGYGGAQRYPVNYLLTATVFHFFGETEFTARILPALWGTATVALLYLLGAYLFSESIGLLAALVLALHPYHIFWSQNARHYALLGLLLLVLLMLLLRIRANQSSWLPAVIVFFLALGTHTTALLVMPALLAGFGRRVPKRWWAVVAGAALVFFCLCLTWEPLRAVTVERFTGGRLWGGDAVHLAAATAYHFNPIILLLAVYGWYCFREDTRAGFIMYWVLLPLTVLFLLTFFGDVSIAYGAFTLPVVILLASAGVTRFACPRALALLMVAVLLPPLYWYYDSNGQRPRYREAAALIDEIHGMGWGKYVYTTMPRTFSYYVKTPVVGVSPKLLTDGDVLLLVDPDFAYLNPGLSLVAPRCPRLQLWGELPAGTPVRDYSLTVYYVAATR